MRFLVIKKKTLVLTVMLLAAAALIGVSAIQTNAAAVYLGYTTRQLPVYNVDTEEAKVAISFDAAWGAEKTEGIIDTLKQHDARATFFLVGFWARKYPELVKKIDAAGLEIGSHSNTHQHMPKLSDVQLDLDLTASKAAISDITGKEVKVFRAPFGDYSDRMMEACKRADLKVIQWDVDSLDWKDLSAAEMTQRVLSRVKKGSIILFHNDGKHTLTALPAILLGLKNKGYEVVSAGDILLDGEHYIDHAGTMRKK